jgi:hypothetical protein
MFVKQNRLSRCDYVNREYVIVAEMFVGVTLIILAHYLHWVFFGSRLYDVPFFLLRFTITFAEYVIHLQFIYFVFSLRQHFGDMNLVLRKMYLKMQRTNKAFYKSPDLIRILQSCRWKHNYMCGIAEWVNSVYAPFILFNSGLSFFHSVHNLYCIACLYSEGRHCLWSSTDISELRLDEADFFNTHLQLECQRGKWQRRVYPKVSGLSHNEINNNNNNNNNKHPLRSNTRGYGGKTH